MLYYEYIEYDENDMVAVYEYTNKNGGTYFSKINFSIDYKYGVYTYNKLDFDYSDMYEISDIKNTTTIFEYESKPIGKIDNDIIWR